MKKKHIALIILFIVLAAILACLGILYMQFAKEYEDCFFRGTVINGIEAEGLTVEEIERQIEAGTDRDYSLTVTFPDGGTETITAEDIDYGYVSDGSVQRLKDAQKPVEWIRGYLFESVVTVPVNMTYDEALLDQAVSSLPELQDQDAEEPRDAYMEFRDSAFVIVPDIQGKEFRKENAVQLIKDAVAAHETELALTESDLYVYTFAAVTADDPKLTREADRLNSYICADITYDLPGTETQRLDGSVLIGWLVKDSDGNYRKDYVLWEEKIREYVADLAQKVDTIGTVKAFPATGIGDILVTCMTYGYEIDQEAEIEWLTEALNEGAFTEHRPTYLSWETSEPDVNNGFGDTYIEIDCTRQHLWAYQDGQIAFETDIVSGAMDGGRATPSGAYMFVTKESPSTLVGRDDNGKEIYRVTVTYFMPFNSMAVGIHDATWQPVFGGTRYLECYGSHGCINVSYSAAETLYNMITFEEPVVVYYQ